MSDRLAAVTRVSASATLAVVVDGPGDQREAAGRLERLYGVGVAQISFGPRVHLLITGETSDRLHAEDRRIVCWGTPIGAAGHATDAEITDALETERSTLGGTWVLAGETRAGGFRCRSSANHVHTLKTIDRPTGRVWATRGLAAHAVVDRRPTIDMALVPERILWDLVFNDDELLAGCRLVPDAWQLDVTPEGAPAEGTWWPLAERLADTQRSNARSLADTLLEVLAPYERLQGLSLGLTAGQDSSLLAAGLHDACPQLVPDAFTIGLEQFPDVIGARASAAALGWPHRVVGASEPSSGPTFDAAVRQSIWTEGLDHGRNVSGAQLLDVFPSPSVWMTGSGGEVARAFYWAEYHDHTDPVDVMLDHRRHHLDAKVKRHLDERVRFAVDDAARLGHRGLAALDVVYLRNRMRSWLNRTTPRPNLDGWLAPFLEPAIVTELLGFDRHERRSGHGFRSALDAFTINPLAIALTATNGTVKVPPPPKEPPSAARRAVGAARAKVRARVSRPATGTPHAELAAVLSLYEASPYRGALVRDALGARWFDAAIEASTSGAVTQLWNGIAVEALAATLDKTLW